MQSYKDPQSSPGGRGAAPPITMTMSLNGPPGYHMQPSPMHGYLPHQPGAMDGGPVVAGGGVLGDVTAGGASIAGADVNRTQREQYIAQQHQQPQQGSRSKQSVGGSPGSGATVSGASGAGASSNSGGGGGGGGAGMQYRARPDQMQLAAQHQHMLQHQQRQHGMSSTHLRSTAMGMHSPQQQHQHHIHHQQHHPSQLHGSQQSAQMTYMSEKDSRGGSGVFKTPPSLGYSASAVGSPAVGQTMTNGIPGMHPQQYSGFHMMKDTPMRGDTSGIVDSMKQRMGAGTSGSVSAMSPRSQAGPSGMAGFRQSGSTNSSESSRHHAQQPGLHSTQQQQQQQHVMMHPQTQQSQQHLAQHPLLHHQQQQPSHLQSMPHAGPQPSHYSGHTQQKAALSSSSHVTPHSLPQNPMALPLSHRAVASSHGQAPPAPIYAPAPPAIHPPGHPGLSPVTQDPHVHQLHHLHPQGHPTQPPMQSPSHLRSGSSPPPPGTDLYLRASPASAPALTPRHQGLDTGMNVHADGSMQLMSVRSQPSVGSIRTGEPRVQTQSAGCSSTRSASASGPLMGVSGGSGLMPTHTMSKGSIQMGTPAVKPVVINTDVRVNSEVSRGCKVSPGGNGPLDLSKLRPEPTRPGDCPLDLSVKPRKRPLEEGGHVDDDKELASLALIKKPRSGPTPPKSSYELSGLHYSSNMPVVNTQPPGLTSQPVKPSTVPVKGDHPVNPSIPVMTYPTSQGFKPHLASPSMSGYLSGQGLQASVGGPPSKVPHSHSYPDRGSTHSRSNSSSSRGSTPLSRPHSIEMTFEGKGDDLSSLMPKIVKGITASPPTMISSLHSQLERVQQMKPEVMPGHGHSIPMKHQHPHQLPPQQMLPRDVVPSYSMNGCEKPRTGVSDTHMQKSVSVQQQQQQQSMQLQRHQQACCPPKTAQSLTMGAPKASPQSTSHAPSEPHSLEFPTGQHVGQPHLYPQQKYHHQMQKQQPQQHHLAMHRHQSQQQQQRIHLMHEHQQKQQQHYQHVPRQQSQKQQAREAKYGQQQLQQGIVGSPYMYDMAVREHDIHKVKQHFHGPLPDGAGEDALSWRQQEVPSTSIVQGAVLAAAEAPVIMRPCNDKQHHQQRSSTDKSVVASASATAPSPSLRPVKFEESPRGENCRSGYYARKPSLGSSAQEGEKRSTPSSDLHSALQSNLLRLQEKDTKNLKGSAGAAGDALATAVASDSCKQVEIAASSGRIVTGAATREQGVEDARPPSPVSQEHDSLVDDALSEETTTPTTPKKAADSFQRPHPITVGSSSNVGGSTSISSKKPFDNTSQAEVVSKETAAIKSESCATASPAPLEDFTSPLSISIPHSPAQEADSKQSASAIPPPPKMLPRKRMILNAYNKDETMRKFIGVPAPKGDLGPPGSTVSKTDHQRPRHISSSPPPSSPKMPILSPQEKGNEADVTSAQNDDPPTLDPSTPVRGRTTKNANSTPKGSNNSGNGSGGGMSLAAGGGSAGTVVAPCGPGGAQGSSPIAITMDISIVNTTKLTVTSAVATHPNSELEIGADKSESVVVRRCSLTAGDPSERLADPSAQQAGSQVPVSFSRPDVIRRPSLDRPWGHPQKIIPVANVAPFMHNKSAAELSGKEYADSPQSSRGSEPSPHELVQPKTEDRKVLDERKREGVQPEDDETKSSSPSALQNKDLTSSEKRKQTQRSKTVKKTSKLIKKLTSIGKCKPKPGDVVDDLGVPPLSLKYKVLKSSQMFNVHDLDSINSPERKDKTLKKKLAKQKHALKTAFQAGGEKTKPGGLEEDCEEREEEEAAQASGTTPEKSKKDLAQSREERANRRAMLRREEERRSGRKQQKPGKRTARRRLSSTNQKARELKRSAIARRPRRETTKRKSGQYNRNAAYEEEVKRDESRKAIRRARRHASNLARERLQQQQHHIDATDAGDNSQDETQSLPRDDEPWDIASAFSSSRPSRKSKSARVIVGPSGPDGGGGAIARASGKQMAVGLESSDVDEEYYHDADDESKDVSDDDDDAADADFADGNSQSSRGKSRSLASRKKRRGKSRLRRKHAESCFDDDNFESGREDTLLYGEDTVELSGSQCALPVPPEVKRIAVNKNSGETLLHRAARLGNEEVTLYCLRSGEYNVNARDNAGYTALHESCVKGSVRVARHLILHGADVNCCSLDGIRPLHDAVENDHVQVVRLLLSHGADPLIATYGGKTPLKIARSVPMFDLIKGYLGDLNGYGSEDERPWQMPGSYGLHAATGDPDNGFDIFADIPSDGDDVDIDHLFDDGITASIATYLLPAENTNSNPQPVVLQDDLLRQLRIPFKQYSSMNSCMRAQVHVSRPHILRMLEHSALRRGSLQHHALLESDKLTFLPVAVLSKVEAALEQLTRRPSPRTPATSISGSFGLLPDLQTDSDILLIRHLGEMSLRHRDEDAGAYSSVEDEDTKDGCQQGGALKFVISGKVTNGGHDGKQESWALSQCEKSAVMWVKKEKNPLHGCCAQSPSRASTPVPSAPAQRSLPGEVPQPASASGNQDQEPEGTVDKTYLLQTYRGSHVPSGTEDKRLSSGCPSEKHSPFRAVSDASAAARTQSEAMTSYGYQYPESSLPASSAASPAKPSSVLLKAAHFQPKVVKKEYSEVEILSSVSSVSGVGSHTSSLMSSSRPTTKSGGAVKVAGSGIGKALEGNGSATRSSAPSSAAHTWGNSRGSGKRSTSAGGGLVSSGNSVVIKSSGQGPIAGHVTSGDKGQSVSAPPAPLPVPSMESSEMLARTASSGHLSCSPANGSREPRPLPWLSQGGRILTSCSTSRSGRDPSQEHKKSPASTSGSNAAPSREPPGATHSAFPTSLTSAPGREAGRDVRGGKSPNMIPTTFSSAFTQFVNKDLPVVYVDYPRSESRTVQRSSAMRAMHALPKGSSQEHLTSSIKRSAASCPSSLSSTAVLSTASSSYTSGRTFSKEFKSQPRPSQRPASAKKQETPSPSSSSSLSLSTSSQSFASGKLSKEPSRLPHSAGSAPPLVSVGLSRNGSSTILESTSSKCLPSPVPSHGLLSSSSVIKDSGNREDRVYQTLNLGDSQVLPGVQDPPGGRKADTKAKNPQLDFVQMFSDESSSNSFTTVVDNLDYDSSHSPVGTAGLTVTSGSGSEVNAAEPKMSSTGPTSLGASAKSFGFGVFGRSVAGKDTNDNEIHLFTRTKP